MSSDNAPSTPEQLLSPAHLRMLREESAITDEVILARGYRTVTDRPSCATWALRRTVPHARAAPARLDDRWRPRCAT